MWRAVRFTLVLSCAMLDPSVALDASERDRPMKPPSAVPEGDSAKPLLVRWLRTGDDVHAAWAAWLVGERRWSDVGPDVIARLGAEVRRKAEARSDLLEGLLMDAALRLGTPVPEATLRKRGLRTPEVVIYFCRRAAGPIHWRAFAALDRGVGVASDAWFALGGHLFAARHPSLARQLLGSLRLERTLRVFDEAGPHPAFRRPSGGVPGDGFVDVPKGYPPIPVHRLSLREGRGWQQLTRGPLPAYAHRSVSRSGRVGYSVSGRRPSANQARHAWLHGWLSEAARPRLELHATVDVTWGGGRQVWERVAGAAVRAVHQRWRAFRDALVNQGLLTAEQCVGLTPSVAWTVRDERRVKSRPIPQLPEVPFEPAGLPGR